MPQVGKNKSHVINRVRFLTYLQRKIGHSLSREGFILLLLLKLPFLPFLLYLKAAGATTKQAATGVFCQYLYYTLLSPGI